MLPVGLFSFLQEKVQGNAGNLQQTLANIRQKVSPAVARLQASLGERPGDDPDPEDDDGDDPATEPGPSRQDMIQYVKQALGATGSVGRIRVPVAKTSALEKSVAERVASELASGQAKGALQVVTSELRANPASAPEILQGAVVGLGAVQNAATSLTQVARKRLARASMNFRKALKKQGF